MLGLSTKNRGDVWVSRILVPLKWMFWPVSRVVQIGEARDEADAAAGRD